MEATRAMKIHMEVKHDMKTILKGDTRHEKLN